MNISCQKFYNDIGAHCHPVSESVLLVSTPLVFPDNTPVNFYAETHGNTVIITDDGDTLMRLHGIGLGNNPRLADSLDKKAKHHNGALLNGCLTFTAKSVRESYANYLKTMLDIINYEYEHTALTEEKITAINDVVVELQRRNPGCAIEHNVSIKGSTGASYTLALKAGDRLIELTTPHHQSTGAILRRVADIEKAGAMPPLIIVDDTGDMNRGAKEASLIGAFVPSMLLTTLKAEHSPLDLAYH